MLDHDGIAGGQPVNGFQDGRERLALLAVVQMTVPGAPTIYYGDEVGLAGYGSDIPRDDPYNRQPYPWSDEAGYGTLPAWRQADTDLLQHYRTLTSLRNSHSFLRTGSWNTLETDDANKVLVYGRRDNTGVAVIAINRDTVAHDVTLDVDGYVPEGAVLDDGLEPGTSLTVGAARTMTFNVSGMGARLGQPAWPGHGATLRTHRPDRQRRLRQRDPELGRARRCRCSQLSCLSQRGGRRL
ncbi:MAG: hypothetical protein IPH87_11700 [Anaerolineae bacterium]|nr:hypothetical protein [Anaerolineae bacterium]